MSLLCLLFTQVDAVVVVVVIDVTVIVVVVIVPVVGDQNAVLISFLLPGNRNLV